MYVAQVKSWTEYLSTRRRPPNSVALFITWNTKSIFAEEKGRGGLTGLVNCENWTVVETLEIRRQTWAEGGKSAGKGRRRRRVVARRLLQDPSFNIPSGVSSFFLCHSFESMSVHPSSFFCEVFSSLLWHYHRPSLVVLLEMVFDHFFEYVFVIPSGMSSPLLYPPSVVFSGVSPSFLR